MTSWVGTFEAHVTVETDRPAAFEALCHELGVKCILIELAAGEHRAQPMTATHHRGALGAVRGEVETLRGKLVAAGYPVVRVKLEALLGGDAGPVDDPVNDAHGYFEFHAKLRLDGSPSPELVAICARHAGHLSRNDRKRGERFVTLRVYRATRADAEAKFDALLAELAAIDHPAIATKREYTVFDGNVDLDAGWLSRT